MTRAPAAALPMSDGQRVALAALARSQVAPHRQVQRAKALMLAAEGMANSHIAEDLELSPITVRAWRERFGPKVWPSSARSGRAGAANRRSATTRWPRS